nr:transposase [Alkalibaculum sporogenes]
MCRSITEVTLFKNDSDKIKYLQLMALYCKKLKCSILAYCLMDNHVHIQLDPQGCDISKYMHGLNLCYAQYYNRKYQRHGPVFQGRFISKVIDEDEYNLIVSAYIHNNPKNLPDYSDCVDTYRFSSYGIYLGIHHDYYGMLNTDFILSQFSNNYDTAKTVYTDFVSSCNNVTQKQKQFEIIDAYVSKDPYEYRSERYIYYRDLTPRTVIETVAEVFGIGSPDFIKIKYSHSVSSFKAISIFLMRCLCDYSYKDICKEIGNLTLSEVAKLSGKGFTLINTDPKYQKLLAQLFERIRAA